MPGTSGGCPGPLFHICAADPPDQRRVDGRQEHPENGQGKRKRSRMFATVAGCFKPAERPDDKEERGVKESLDFKIDYAQPAPEKIDQMMIEKSETIVNVAHKGQTHLDAVLMSLETANAIADSIKESPIADFLKGVAGALDTLGNLHGSVKVLAGVLSFALKAATAFDKFVVAAASLYNTMEETFRCVFSVTCSTKLIEATPQDDAESKTVTNMKDVSHRLTQDETVHKAVTDMQVFVAEFVQNLNERIKTSATGRIGMTGQNAKWMDAQAETFNEKKKAFLTTLATGSYLSLQYIMRQSDEILTIAKKIPEKLSDIHGEVVDTKEQVKVIRKHMEDLNENLTFRADPEVVVAHFRGLMNGDTKAARKGVAVVRGKLKQNPLDLMVM
ncbi:uncharacterized protein EV422DRAFT_349437 [Fimicolochytrium jonesii]|uniref:uncharacterized protein n=1 Tax=Fimicolochytrium jonesii TaxID=1396493 RepID=UPI0022FDC847|nr:uncharacterized protein EV422DRAFT_349437 [Fimicolochytrium jonesii]KAI8815610.1 hypothetical protein EV422DRAFT_349437 [Fimicolochytrium jonesii]